MSEKAERNLAILFSTIVALFTYYRLFIGVSAGDEVHYAAQAYLPMMGGHWFVEEKTIQQTAAMLLSPWVWLFTKINGTDGIVLFLRHLHFLLSLVTAGVAFQVLKYFTRWSVALLLATLVVAFVPHSIPNLTYNTMGSLFFGLGTLLAILASIERRRWQGFFSGVCWVLCGFAYPTLIIPFVFFAGAMAYLFSSKPDDREMILFPVILGVLIPATLLSGFLIWCGIDNILSAIHYSSLFASPGQYEKLIYAFYMSWIYLAPPWMTIMILVAWCFVIWKAPKYSAWMLLVFLASVFIFGGLYESMPTQVLWFVISLFFPLFLWSQRGHLSTEQKSAALLLLLPAFVGALVTCLTSRMTLYVMCLTSIFAALMMIAMIIGQARLVGLLLGALLCSMSTYWYYQIIYEDDKFALLTYQIEDGPFAGLHTFPQKGQFLEKIQYDLKNAGIEGKSILFRDLFPGGYLMSKNRVLGPTLYIAPANFYPEARRMYAEVFKDRNYWPEIVVELKYYPIYTHEAWPYNVPGLDPYNDPFRDFFMQTGAYEVILDRDSHRFLARKP